MKNSELRIQWRMKEKSTRSDVFEHSNRMGKGSALRANRAFTCYSNRLTAVSRRAGRGRDGGGLREEEMAGSRLRDQRRATGFSDVHRFPLAGSRLSGLADTVRFGLKSRVLPPENVGSPQNIRFIGYQFSHGKKHSNPSLYGVPYT